MIAFAGEMRLPFTNAFGYADAIAPQLPIERTPCDIVPER